MIEMQRHVLMSSLVNKSCMTGQLDFIQCIWIFFYLENSYS